MDFEYMGYIYILSKASSIAFKIYILQFPILTGNRTHNLVVSAMLYCLRYKYMLIKSFRITYSLKGEMCNCRRDHQGYAKQWQMLAGLKGS